MKQEIKYDFDYRKALIDKIKLKNSSDDLKYDLLDDYIQQCTHDDSLGCDITELRNDEVIEYLEERNLTIDSPFVTVIGDMNEFNDNKSYCHWFVVYGDCENCYIYQDWEQVWENIIYDLSPEEWLTAFCDEEWSNRCKEEELENLLRKIRKKESE